MLYDIMYMEVVNKHPLGLKVFGIIAFILFAVGFYLALVVSPLDKDQGQLVRILYAHVSVAWICFLAVILCAIFGSIYLWNSSELSDILAVASAEMALFYSGLTIIGGMTWGKATWTVWWAWDAKLTTTALMFFLLVGYFIVRGLIENPQRRGRVSAVIGLVILADVPIVYFASEFFNTLHQPLSLQIGEEPQMDPIMIKILLFNVLAAGLVYAYFMLERVRLGRLESRLVKEQEHPKLTSEVIHV